MQSLLPSLNVVENVKLPLLLMGIDDKEAQTSALEILNRIELAGLADSSLKSFRVGSSNAQPWHVL